MSTKSITLAALVFLGACAAQWDEPTTDKVGFVMARSSTAITPTIKPNSLVIGHPDAEVYPPLATTTTLANDVGASLETIENQIFTLVDEKVDRAGDTMTSTLTVTPDTAVPALVLNAATNTTAATINGNGTAAALTVIAGAASGAAVLQSNYTSYTAEITNNGAGGALQLSGSTNPLQPTLSVSTGAAPTASQPRMGTQHLGYIAMTGADPSHNVDPGADNAIHGSSIPKAWVLINSSYSILDGLNVASVTNIAGSIYEVTFVRPMANVNYGVEIHVGGAPGYSGAHNGTKTVNGFRFVLYKTTDLTLGFGSATEALIKITGKQ